VAVLGGVFLAGVGHAAAPGPDPGLPIVNLTPYVPSATADGASTSLGARLDVGLQRNDFQTSLQAALETAATDVDGGPRSTTWGQAWWGEKIALTGAWTPTSAARLDLSLADQSRRDLVPGVPFLAGSAGQILSTRTQTTQAAATLTPFTPLTLQVGGSASQGVTDTQAIDALAATGASTSLQTSAARAFAGLTWRPVSGFSLDVGEALEARGVAWRGVGADTARFSYPAPHLTAAFRPWAQAEWTFSVARVVSAFSADQFAAFAQASGPTAAGAFQPDREWRSMLSVKQTLPGAMTVSASFTQAQLESVTDFAPVGQVQAPSSIGGGRRQAVDVAVATPLNLPFLPPLTLSGQGSWRASQVTDPFTGAPRSLSGEAPYAARLSVGGALDTLPVSWSLKADVTGPASVFQMSQVDTLTAGVGLGGSLAYRAGALTLGLQVDNLVGGVRNDISQKFNGSRASGALGGTAESHSDSRAVRITLRKSL
jgi:hypothetical protein